MSEQVYRLGRGPRHHKPVQFGVSQAARTLRFQLNDGVPRWKLRWPLVFMVNFLLPLGIERGADVSEQVYRLGRVLRHLKPVRFGASKAARTLIFQLKDGLLRWKLRWPFVFIVISCCLWVSKGRTDVSEQGYRLGRGPRHHKPVRF